LPIDPSLPIVRRSAYVAEVVVKLINTDGMALIGPGSEWFWTALSGLVLAVTFLGIYRQLRIARSANAFEQMNRLSNEWDSERMNRHKLEILLALQAGVKPENVPSGAASYVRDFWDDMGLLIKAGHIDRRLVYESFTAPCRAWWATLAPVTRRLRTEAEDPRLSISHEWLDGIMADMDAEAGIVLTYDEAFLVGQLGERIARARDQVRISEELRAVIVRPMSVAVPPAFQPATMEDAHAAESA
jgi:hypothetical protein